MSTDQKCAGSLSAKAACFSLGTTAGFRASVLADARRDGRSHHLQLCRS